MTRLKDALWLIVAVPVVIVLALVSLLFPEEGEKP